tara:strand:- start:4043 stop:4264 length:222 start_codon:yes stop_codon:yes gene_type:complete
MTNKQRKIKSEEVKSVIRAGVDLALSLDDAQDPEAKAEAMDQFIASIFVSHGVTPPLVPTKFKQLFDEYQDER